MRRIVKMLALVLAVMMSLPMVSATAADPSESTGSGLVVVVLAPYMTWDDVASGMMPETAAAAGDGAVGNMSTRASARFTSNMTQVHAALTISASSSSASDAQAPAAYSVDERYELGNAAEAYERIMGASPGESAIVYLGLPRIERANVSQTLETEVGALGQAIHDAGGLTAAIGNSDYGYMVTQASEMRPAALLAMDGSGLVDLGDVSYDTLLNDDTAPYGVATDIEVMREELTFALESMDACSGPGLIVVDPGDPERAKHFATEVADSVAVEQWNLANMKVDEVVGMVRESIPEDVTLIIVSDIQAKSGSGPVGFAPIIVEGDGWQGVVTTPSTHRTGITPELDVAPTILDILGVDRPVSMLGNVMDSDGSTASLGDRIAELDSLGATAVAVDTVRLGVTNTYIGVTIALLIFGTAFMLRIKKRRPKWAGPALTVLRDALLFMLGIPVSATLYYLLVRRPDSPFAVLALLVGVSVFVWVIMLLIARRWGAVLAAGTVGLLTAGVLIGDQLLGAPLSFSGFFSYSPLWGARYYGIGNEGAAILVGAALLGVALLFDHFRHAKWVAPVKRWVLPVFGLLVVVVSAAPFFGANVGVAAWGVVAFGVAWLQMNGHKVTWKSAVLAVVLVVVIVAAFSAYDLMVGGDTGQTHLGRAWQSASEGGISELWTIVLRKAETNLRVLQASNWSYLLFVILGFLAYMRWRPQGDFAEALERYPHFAIAMTAALLGSLAGYFTEDSGIVIPALVMLYIGGGILYLMLTDVRDTAGEIA